MIDVFLGVGTQARGAPNLLLHNDGNFVFSNAGSGAAPLSAQSFNTNSVVFGDYDGDGLPDLLVGNANSAFDPEPNELYHNDGNGDFTAVSTAFTQSYSRTYFVGFVDLDGDGDLDVVVGNANEANEAYRNADGLGNWVSVSYSFCDTTYFTYTMSLTDVDADGKVDVILGQAAESSETLAKEMYRKYAPVRREGVHGRARCIAGCHLAPHARAPVRDLTFSGVFVCA